MKAGKTLTELAIELERQAASKRDFVADTRMIEMQDDGDIVLHGIHAGLENPAEEFRTTLTRHAHSQIAQRIKIPMQYYERMQKEAPELLARNVNHWFQENPEKRMVRTLDGQARAFLSERYRPLDHIDLARAALSKIAEVGCRIESCEITPSRMYLKAVTDRITGEVKRGDAVQAGIVISNSEVGAGSLRVEPLLYRLACLNGMVVADNAMRKYHVGRGHGGEDDARELFRDETKQADDRAFWLKVQDTIAASLDQAVFNKSLDKMRQALELPIEGKIDEVVEVVAARYGMNESEQDSVLKHLIKGGDLTAFGLLNAVTRTAQDLEDYDRSTEFERVGGQILELSKTEWSKINAA